MSFSFNVYFPIGKKSSSETSLGMAHLVEHLLGIGSYIRNFISHDYDFDYNASTGNDYTEFYANGIMDEQIAYDSLGNVLEYISEPEKYINEAILLKEKLRVHSEYISIKFQNNIILDTVLYLFTGNLSGVGNMETLKSVSLEQIFEFIRKKYALTNASIEFNGETVLNEGTNRKKYDRKMKQKFFDYSYGLKEDNLGKRFHFSSPNFSAFVPYCTCFFVKKPKKVNILKTCKVPRLLTTYIPSEESCVYIVQHLDVKFSLEELEKNLVLEKEDKESVQGIIQDIKECVGSGDFLKVSFSDKESKVEGSQLLGNPGFWKNSLLEYLGDDSEAISKKIKVSDLSYKDRQNALYENTKILDNKGVCIYLEEMLRKNLLNDGDIIKTPFVLYNKGIVLWTKVNNSEISSQIETALVDTGIAYVPIVSYLPESGTVMIIIYGGNFEAEKTIRMLLKRLDGVESLNRAEF